MNSPKLLLPIALLFCALQSLYAQIDSTKLKPFRDTTFKEDTNWGSMSPSQGFVVAKTPKGSLNISGYALFRYVNQVADNPTFQDHLGRTQPIDTRRDLQLHRILVFMKGFLYDPKFTYNITFWTVLSTQQVNIIGNMGYNFHKRFNLYAGVNGLPGTRSLMNSHPFWLGTDRVMADDYFRPGFTSGVWASGEILPRVFYSAMVGNNLSQLGINAKQLTRDYAYAATLYWQPTTGEFGPKGSYGDWEYHDKLATRFGTCFTTSVEDRYNQTSEPSPDNTQIKISDSQLLFATGALADTVTVQTAKFNLLTADLGFKYKGIFLQTELYYRVLNNLTTDGPIPLNKIVDKGFYVQAAFFPVKNKLEIYGATSQIYGQFNRSYEYLIGTNVYPFGNRFFRLNAHVIHVTHAAANSTFGYYVGGQTGMIYSLATAVFF